MQLTHAQFKPNETQMPSMSSDELTRNSGGTILLGNPLVPHCKQPPAPVVPFCHSWPIRKVSLNLPPEKQLACSESNAGGPTGEVLHSIWEGKERGRKRGRERERERQRQRQRQRLYINIYIYIEREREIAPVYIYV